MCHSVTNFYFSPQAPIPTSFADHFCSSQSKKETAEKMFFFCNKNWNKIKFNCVRISRLQRRRKIAILHLISRWSSNESSELSFLLFISRFYYAKQRVKFMGCEDDSRQFAMQNGFRAISDFSLSFPRRFVISGDAFATSDCKCFMRCIICNFKSKLASLYLFTNSAWLNQEQWNLKFRSMPFDYLLKDCLKIGFDWISFLLWL